MSDKPEDRFEEFAATSEYAAHIKKFNDRFYIVGDFGGKCRVCWEERNPTTQSLLLHHQSFGDFRNRFGNKMVVVGTDPETKEPILRTEANAWLSCPERQQYDSVHFAPEEDLGPSIRNLWRGFGVTPREGCCEKYLAHIKDNICAGDQERYNWLLGWMAYKIAHPGEQGHVALALRGREGAGKNCFAEGFAKLFGSHYVQVAKQEHVAGRFNAHLRACCLLVANEAFFSGSKSHEAALKNLITENTILIESKGVDATFASNCVSVILLSNSDWIVPAGQDARRFSVFDCSDEHLNDTKYFGEIADELAHGGYEALLYHLQHNVELKEFDPRRHLATPELAEQKALTLRGAEALWFICLYSGQLPGGLTRTTGQIVVRSSDLLDWWRHQHRRDSADVTPQSIGLLLSQNPRGIAHGMDFKKTKMFMPEPNGGGSTQANIWIIPQLPEARATWDEKRGYKSDWPNDTEWEYVKAGPAGQTVTVKIDNSSREPGDESFDVESF